MLELVTLVAIDQQCPRCWRMYNPQHSRQDAALFEPRNVQARDIWRTPACGTLLCTPSDSRTRGRSTSSSGASMCWRVHKIFPNLLRRLRSTLFLRRTTRRQVRMTRKRSNSPAGIVRVQRILTSHDLYCAHRQQISVRSKGRHGTLSRTLYL
jgi:hypothetical protein